MSQAISNKVLVQSSKYCWMICDYTMSGTTLNYSLSFYFEGGCAQLDNAWIKVGSTTVWSNTGRVHNYNSGQPWNQSHTVSIHSGTATISGSQTVSFGVTKYQNKPVSGSFVVSGGSAPTGLAVDLLGFTDTTVRLKGHVDGYGSPASANNRFVEVSVLGSTTYGPPYRYMKAYNVNDIDITVDNNSLTWGENICNITGNTTYHYGVYADNTSLTSSMIAPATFVTLPAYIIDLNVVSTGGGTVNVAVVHGAEGNALTVYTEYSWDGENWTTVSDPFNVTITEPKTIYVRRFSDAGETPVFSKLLIPNNGKALYGSVNSHSKSLSPVYATFGNYFDGHRYLARTDRSVDVYGDNVTITKVSSGSGGWQWVAFPIDATDEIINKQITITGEMYTSSPENSMIDLYWLNTAGTNYVSQVSGFQFTGHDDKFTITGTVPSRPSNAGNLCIMLYSNKESQPQGTYTVFRNVELKANVKNMFNYLSPRSVGGLTTTLATDGTLTVTGVLSANYQSIVQHIIITDLLDDGAKYTLSSANGVTADLCLELRGRKTGTTTYSYWNTRGSASTTVTIDKTTYDQYAICVVTSTTASWGTSSKTVSNKFQLEKGPSATSFAPFVDTKTHKLKKIYGSVGGRAKLIYDEGA